MNINQFHSMNILISNLLPKNKKGCGKLCVFISEHNFCTGIECFDCPLYSAENLEVFKRDLEKVIPLIKATNLIEGNSNDKGN